MELVDAKERVKNVSREFFNEVVEKVMNNKTGYEEVLCDTHICSVAQRELAEKLLREKGYQVTYGSTSKGFLKMIIKW